VLQACRLLYIGSKNGKPGEAERVKEDPPGVAIGLLLEGTLKAQEGSGLGLAVGLAEIHPPLALYPPKQEELDHQQSACTQVAVLNQCFSVAGLWLPE